jgi:hypothetical protein
MRVEAGAGPASTPACRGYEGVLTGSPITAAAQHRGRVQQFVAELDDVERSQ